MGNTPILDISWQGHGSGGSPPQTSSPDDVRYLPKVPYLPTYLSTCTLPTMDGFYRYRYRYIPRRWRKERRDDGERREEKMREEEEEEKTGQNRRQSVLHNLFFFFFQKRYARGGGGGKRRKEQEKAKKRILYIPYRPFPKFPQLPGRLPQCPRGLPYVHTSIHTYIHT